MAKHNIGDYSIEAGENGLETEAFSIGEASIDKTARQSAVKSNDLTPTALSHRAYMMDDENSRIWNEDGSQYSDDYGDTWSATSDSVPTGTDGEALIFASNGYLFAATWEPLELYRTSYSTGGWTWTKVLSGQANSSLIRRSGRHGLIDVNPNTGTLLIGEYTLESDPYGPRIYRSTDNGASWTTVAEFTNLRHVHSVGHDPYNDGHWISCLGDNDTQRYAESWDDGQTWERKEFGPYDGSQAVGFDFGEDYLYFSEDKGAMPVGPWAYDRDTGETHLLCSEHPKRAFGGYLEEAIQYSLVHDRETGITYFDVRELEAVREWGEVLAYVRFIGDQPQLIQKVNRARLRVLGDYIFNAETFGKDRRYNLLNRGGN